MLIGPRSETEHAIAAFWTALGMTHESIDDGFLAAGGEFDGAEKLLAWVASRWGVEISLEDFLLGSRISSTIRGLAATIDLKTVEVRTHDSDLLRHALDELETLSDA